MNHVMNHSINMSFRELFLPLKKPCRFKVRGNRASISDFFASSSGTKFLFLAILERQVPLGLLLT